MEEASSKIKKVEQATESVGSQLVGLAKGQMTLGRGPRRCGALAESMNTASQNAARMAKDFVELQRTMQGLAAITVSPTTTASQSMKQRRPRRRT